MRALASHRFHQLLEATPPQIQRAFEKQLRYLLHDLRHPSLRAKKYDPNRNLWQARVTGSWAVLFSHRGRRLHAPVHQISSEIRANKETAPTRTHSGRSEPPLPRT